MAEFSTKEMMNFVLLNDLWYVGYCNKRTASTIKHRHIKGILTDATYEKVFAHFGFRKQITWTNGVDL